MEAAYYLMLVMTSRKEDLFTHCLNNVVNQFLRFVDLVLGIGHDQTMQILFLVAGVSRVRTTFSFFDRALATNGNLGTRLSFHFLERVASRSDK